MLMFAWRSAYFCSERLHGRAQDRDRHLFSVWWSVVVGRRFHHLKSQLLRCRPNTAGSSQLLMQLLYACTFMLFVGVRAAARTSVPTQSLGHSIRPARQQGVCGLACLCELFLYLAALKSMRCTCHDGKYSKGNTWPPAASERAKLSEIEVAMRQRPFARVVARNRGFYLNAKSIIFVFFYLLHFY